MGIIMRNRKCYTGKVKERPTIETLEFNVTNVPINIQWSSIYASGDLAFDTGIDLTNKKVIATFTSVDTGVAWYAVEKNSTNTTKLILHLYRGTSTTVSGKFFVMISD